MHCAIWTWHRDPDDLACRHERTITSIPADSMQFSACARVDPDDPIDADTD